MRFRKSIHQSLSSPTLHAWHFQHTSILPGFPSPHFAQTQTGRSSSVGSNWTALLTFSAWSAANVVLFSHIGAGGVGLLSGTGALIFTKGGRAHRLAGNVFFVSMLAMSAIGTCVAPFLPQRGSIIGGAFTFYLVATAWMTVRRKAGSVGTFEIGAIFVALAIAAGGVIFGIQASRTSSGILDGTPSVPYFVFGSVAALAAGLDLRMVIRGGVVGAQRIARHLWRMCLALLIAVISFFLGQSQVFPAAIQDSAILYVPEIAVLGLLIFWMFRVQLSKRYRNGAPNRPAVSGSVGH